MVGYISHRMDRSPSASYIAHGTRTQASPHQSIAISGMVAGKP